MIIIIIIIIIIVTERKGKGLKFALNIKFWIESYFFITIFQGKDASFLLVFNVVENEHFRIFCCTTNTPMQ